MTTYKYALGVSILARVEVEATSYQEAIRQLEDGQIIPWTGALGKSHAEVDWVETEEDPRVRPVVMSDEMSD